MMEEAKKKTDSLNKFHLLSHPSEEIVPCPSCDAELKRYEVAEHYELEMERLKKMKVVREVGQGEVEEPETNGAERRKPWTVFQRIQKNRQSRLRQRTRRRPATPLERACPICNKSYPQDDIESHAEECLRRSNGNTNGNDDQSSEDGEGGEEYEEYEWAGQKRIRVSSLLQGGYAAIGVGQATTIRSFIQDNDEEDEDLNVDEDDTHIYGPPQYGEGDVITPSGDGNEGEFDENEESNVTNYVRRLITENNSSPTTSATVKNDLNKDNDLEAPSSTATSYTLNTTAEHIIESLKCKLRHYENQVQNKFKCLICLDDYKNPAISVACWHVHCEQCWLRSLGARKLCPQCNLITTPKDLRRIYM